jgi:hypothetical protein
LPVPLNQYFTFDKRLSENSFIANCEVLQKKIVFKLLKGVKEYQNSLEKWINMTNSDHIVSAYDTIPLKDDSILQVTEYRESCKNVYKSVAKFDLKLSEQGQLIQIDYAKFVVEYVLQVSIALLDCHK